MTLLLPTHHSSADWDYDSDFWELSAAQFVSPPTSFGLTRDTYVRPMLRIPAAQCLPEGRLTSWFRVWGSAGWGFYFRNQAPLGSSSGSNSYRLRTRCVDAAVISCYTAGAYVWGDTFPFMAFANTWYRIRLTWEMTVDEEENPALAIKLEVEEDGEWVDKGTRQHTNPLWTDSPINRIGLYCAGWMCYNDDLELERPG